MKSVIKNNFSALIVREKKLPDILKVLYKKHFEQASLCTNDEDAIKAFKKIPYDIVIIDLDAKSIDIKKLLLAIRSINSKQHIILLSDEKDSDFLLQVLSIGIKHFFIKPVAIKKLDLCIDSLLHEIYLSSKAQAYREELEDLVTALKKENRQLHSTLRILDTKIAQSSVNISQYDKSVQINDADLEEMKECEVDIDGVVQLLQLNRSIDPSNIALLSDLFCHYADILHQYEIFSPLGSDLDTLSVVLTDYPDVIIAKIEQISTLVESFVYVLHKHRNACASDQEVQTALQLHASMNSDIETLISIIKDEEYEIDNDIEFF